jgi:hypothetical protein
MVLKENTGKNTGEERREEHERGGRESRQKKQQ